MDLYKLPLQICKNAYTSVAIQDAYHMCFGRIVAGYDTCTVRY